MKKYMKLVLAGVSLFIDRLIAKDGSILFASVFGNTEAVKSALAGLVSGCVWYAGEDSELQYGRFNGVNYSIKSQKLSGTNAVQGIAWVPEFFDIRRDIKPVNIVYGNSEAEIHKHTFQLLKKFTTVPLLDSWQEVILNDLFSFIALDTFGIGYAYEIELPNDEQLEDFILSNIKYLKTLV